ncbi:DUF881 domain-containing protein [Micromonospora coxensis]|uniref:Uncharacterized conserved protein YlxW, UPF0749 family n=1 Tax=Micromonospora coxensis TaxID=356852 RepID=A0A1C5GQR1_9ACTN|nr:DUF881 domain-containing protein [Micromonospora coxensis]SCG36053.1 Uncharacterized conserved protein YlxW, UPF0749 family [Micromonospora coxensis]
MSDEQRDTGTGWPEPTGPNRPSGPAGEPDPRPDAPDPDEISPLVVPEEPRVGGVEDDAHATVDLAEAAVAPPEPEPEPTPAGAGGRGAWGGRVSSAGVMIAVLLALLGFTLVVQLKTTSTDPTLAATRQEDLVRIFSDLDSREKRLQQDIEALEESQRQLRSGEQGRQAALEEARRRADQLGILAGTLPARGPGLSVRFVPGGKPIAAERILDAVQELRGAGAEAMQISGVGGSPVRIIASTYFLDGQNGSLVVDGRSLSGPYTITVIGDPTTMSTALKIPGGVAATVAGDGGNVIVEEREVAEVSALHGPMKLEHARPVS